MDTRSVIAGINVNNERKISGIFTVQQNSIHSMVEVLSWLTEQKAKYYIQIEKLSLAKLKKWVKYFFYKAYSFSDRVIVLNKTAREEMFKLNSKADIKIVSNPVNNKLLTNINECKNRRFREYRT